MSTRKQLRNDVISVFFFPSYPITVQRIHGGASQFSSLTEPSSASVHCTRRLSWTWRESSLCVFQLHTTFTVGLRSLCTVSQFLSLDTKFTFQIPYVEKSAATPGVYQDTLGKHLMGTYTYLHGDNTLHILLRITKRCCVALMGFIWRLQQHRGTSQSSGGLWELHENCLLLRLMWSSHLMGGS